MVFAKSYSAQLARSRHGARRVNASFVPRPPIACVRMIVSGLIDGLRQDTKLGGMPRRRPGFFRSRVSRGTTLLPFLLWACERSEPVVRNDTPPAASASATNPTAVATRDDGWIAMAGPALLVQGASRDEAIALFPASRDSDAVARLDSVSLSEVPVVLFGRGGQRFSAQLGAPTGEGSDECERWPLHAF